MSLSFAAPFCLRIYQEILQSSNGALLWTFLKPLLHGKILYNSNLNMVDLVMKKVSTERSTIYWCWVCTEFLRFASFRVGRSSWIIVFWKTGFTLPSEFSPCFHFQLTISLKFDPACYSGCTSVWKADFVQSPLKLERLKGHISRTVTWVMLYQVYVPQVSFCPQRFLMMWALMAWHRGSNAPGMEAC